MFKLIIMKIKCYSS